ncbi:diamine acetyltransferase 1-like [Babylonia areolata]|uniref:diamine acetyltransferase 1-like n=1 Tax=Babylonia areolata TaxID=304850 RepID=UPI003FCF6BCD
MLSVGDQSSCCALDLLNGQDLTGCVGVPHRGCILKDRTALSQRCIYVEWIVYNWNQPSIDYYKRRGARDVTTEAGQLLFRLKKSAMESFLTSPPAPRDAP